MAENQPIISPPEEWRPVVGYEYHYEVSSHGRVRSIDRAVTDKIGRTRALKGKDLSAYVNKLGYRQVALSDSAGQKSFNVHILVALAFIGNRPSREHVCHVNGDPSDNRVENLRFGTASENAWDAVHHGTHTAVQKMYCPRGHDLRLPNLVKSLWDKKQYRDCLSCSRARAKTGYHKNLKPQFDQIADGYYEAIMRPEWKVA